ncbi:hypothetical protein BS78_10G185800 [Paspalum vaginatum]|nr:hypothetical protein BS78_10G185800 [Paspalum vaginatum]
MADLLPEEVLANIIRRLAPRHLAISRCVCKAWCTVIDAHNLLRVDLLPHSVMSEFFSRPSKGTTVSGKFEYLPTIGQVIDHCNGLLLVAQMSYHVFDPTLSPHYEVFLIPWLWEERLFVREGEAVGNVADMRLDWPYVQDDAVYWQGVLYVNYQTKFVMRISLSNGEYQVIKPPVGFEWSEPTDLYLGKSEKGVYCALCFDSSFWIYILDESDGKMEWIFKHPCHIESQGIDGPGPWTLQDINDNWDIEWDSDNDNVIENKSSGGYLCRGYINFLGFHPYKEVIFLSDTLKRGLAYHLNSSKIQDLGNLHPTTNYGTEHGIQPFLLTSFPYTPWRGWFPEDN